jgi:hypothetical protein
MIAAAGAAAFSALGECRVPMLENGAQAVSRRKGRAAFTPSRA